MAAADLFNSLRKCVQDIARQVAEPRESTLSAKQCQDLSSKLLKVIGSIQELVSSCEASAVVAFQPAVEEFLRIVEEAKKLVEDCSRKDWLKASVFQIRNEEAFREILLRVGLCYNVIYAQAKAMSLADGVVLKVEDLRSLPPDSTFRPASEEDVLDDQQTLQRRLEEVTKSAKTSNDVILARYLLSRLTAPAMSEEWSVEVSSIMYDASTLDVSKKEFKATWYRKTKPLSKGSGADGVFTTKWIGIKCAKKIFFHSGPSMNPVFEKEAPLLASINHPNIVKFFCCGISSKEDQCFIGMELMEKSLSKLIEDRRKARLCFPMQVALDIILQLARGMLYMHELGTAHRDLKPHNVGVSNALNDFFCVKLLDFGLSKTKVCVSKSQTVTYHSTGTTKYRAPEAFKDAKYASSKQKVKWFRADVYSFALTCYQILTLQEPYESVKPTALYQKLKDGLRPTLPADCPKPLSALIKECWAWDFNDRPSFWSICERLEKFKHDLLLQGPGADSTKRVDQLRGENVVASSSSYAHIETMLKRRSELRTPAKHLVKVVENEGATSECDEDDISEGNEGDICGGDDAALSKGDEGAISEGGDGAIRTAELEILSLVRLKQKGHEVIAPPYDEWQRNGSLFARRVNMMRLQISFRQIQIYQLIGFDTAFQGVLLLLVSRSDSLHCSNWWTIFTLSVFVSAFTIRVVLQSFNAIYSLEENICHEDYITRCLQKRGKFTFKDHAADRQAQPYPQWKLLFSIFLTVLVLVIFSCFIVIGIHRILCHSDGPSPTSS